MRKTKHFLRATSHLGGMGGMRNLLPLVSVMTLVKATVNYYLENVHRGGTAGKSKVKVSLGTSFLQWQERI